MLYNDNKKTFVKIMHDELYKELYENSWIQMLEQMEHWYVVILRRYFKL